MFIPFTADRRVLHWRPHRTRTTHSLLGSLTKLAGKHSLKFGADARLRRINFFDVNAAGGTYNFNRSLTGIDSTITVANAGNAIASFLLGAGAGGSTPVNGAASLQNYYVAGFVQDDFKVTSKLTVNAGLRYEVESPYTERYNRLAYFDPTLPSPARNAQFPNITGGLVYASDDERHVYDWDLNNWVSISKSPSGLIFLVVRGITCNSIPLPIHLIYRIFIRFLCSSSRLSFSSSAPSSSPESHSPQRSSLSANNWSSYSARSSGRNFVAGIDSSPVALSQLWKDWREALIIVKPETVVKWHREGFRLYWRWKSTAPIGRPKINLEIRELIRQMSRENPLWGNPRIQSELRLLGCEVAERTVAKYRIKHAKPPSQTWKTFLANHAKQIAGIDFFTVPTIHFRNLYCFVMLLHDRREVVHFNVTDHPTAEWAAQQIIEAFPDDEVPRYVLRDRDGIYGQYFRKRVSGMGIEEVITAARSPWQNPFVERLIGTIRRECLDQMIILNEDHLRRILREYFDYYHTARPHQALERNSPTPRKIEPQTKGKVVSIPRVGGLHHHYRRAA